MMPVYTVYKATHLYPGWLDGGERQWRYNRTTSGWFDQMSFEDWFEKVIVPYCKEREGKKLIIGDNLASHLSPRVVQLCLENNIIFVFLPKNSTHMCQPLDVAYFRPFKIAWRRRALEIWKLRNPGYNTLPKCKFPSLLKSVIDVVRSENLISGFRKCGIYPFSREELLSQLPENGSLDSSCRENVADSLIEFLREKRFPEPDVNNNNIRGKKLDIPPGASVTIEMLEEAGPSTSAAAVGKGRGRKRKEFPVVENITPTSLKIKLPKNAK